VPEWSNGTVSKTVEPLLVPRVRPGLRRAPRECWGESQQKNTN
jgi:hypothetical protein